MKSTTKDRIAFAIRDEIFNDREFLPSVKRKLCESLSQSEIEMVGYIVVNALKKDQELKIVKSVRKK